jgi:alkanesulfonate monooxygenase SsuD/methylene tetrahydromethanopterin reductase-like flavin-dependent oxidoreductase (luciferase family)
MGMFLCGSADTVREMLEAYWRDMRFGNLLTMCQFGTLPADLTRANMERFARKVLPEVKKLGIGTESLATA